MMALRRLLIAACATALSMASAAAHAQYDPGASASLGAGYGATALSQSILSGTRAAGGGASSGPSRPSAKMIAFCARWPGESICRRHPEFREPGRGAAVDPGSSRGRPTSQQMQAMQADMMRRLQPEYERRLARDGKPSADAWLMASASVLGRQTGEEWARRSRGR